MQSIASGIFFLVGHRARVCGTCAQEQWEASQYLVVGNDGDRNYVICQEHDEENCYKRQGVRIVARSEPMPLAHKDRCGS